MKEIKPTSILLIFLFFGSLSEAKCKGFDEGSPNFCASIKKVKHVRTVDEECFYEAEIVSVAPSLPLKKQFSFAENEIQNTKIALVRSEKVDCSKIQENALIQGLLVMQCNDLKSDEFFGLGDFIRGLFNNERLYPRFYFFTVPTIVSQVPEGQVSVSCN